MKIDLVELKINGEKSYYTVTSGALGHLVIATDSTDYNRMYLGTREEISQAIKSGNGGNYLSLWKFCVWEDAFERVDNFFINFCPFCGEKIEVSVVEEKDVSDTYKKLEEKKNFFEEEVRNIDRQMAELYKVTEYRED